MSLLRAMQQLSFAGARFATGTAVVQARPAQRRCLATTVKATAEKGLGKGDLIKAVATQTGLKAKDAEGAVNAVIEIIESTVAGGEAIGMAGGVRGAGQAKRGGVGVAALRLAAAWPRPSDLRAACQGRAARRRGGSQPRRCPASRGNLNC